MSESTELAFIPQETALSAFTTAGGLDPILARLKAHKDAFVGDATTAKGRENIRSFAFKFTKSKTYLEAVGKALADEQKEIPKKIDAARKQVKDTLAGWIDEVRKPLTDWEEAEEARQAGIKSAIAELQTVAENPGAMTYTPVQLRDHLAKAEATEITEERFAEYLSAAIAAKAAAVKALTEAIAIAEQREKDAAELAELRRQQAERAAKEREEQIAKEAAERARREAEEHAKNLADAAERKSRAEADSAAQRERDALAATERAEAARKIAEERAARAEQEAKDRAEREHAAKLEAERLEAEKRESNKRHKAKVNNAAVAAFVAGGLPEDMAKLAVTLIAQKSIPAVSVAY